MIGRALGTGSAIAFAAAVVVGSAALIALDFVGADALAAAWSAVTAPKPVIRPAVLEGASDISFFNTVPADGYGFDITTGTAFATPADFDAGLIDHQWCYAQVAPPGAIPRKIDLAESSGNGEPEFIDVGEFSDSELQVLGVSAADLNAMARRDCRFGQGQRQ